MSRIFTIGYSLRSIEEFIDLLKINGVEVLADVRRFPTSKYEDFKKSNLSKSLKNVNIEYVYFGKELGGLRPGGYEPYIGTKDFNKALSKLEDIAQGEAVCYMCAEKNPKACHRRLISRSLALRGWEVVDIV